MLKLCKDTAKFPLKTWSWLLIILTEPLELALNDKLCKHHSMILSYTVFLHPAPVQAHSCCIARKFLTFISFLCSLSCDCFDHAFQVWITLSSTLWAVPNTPWVNYCFTAISCLEARSVSSMSLFQLPPQAKPAQLVRSDAYAHHVLLAELSTAL